MAPVWATSMIRNYHQMYKEKYGEVSTLSDDEIWNICETVFDDTDKAKEDLARVETMREIEK